MNAAPNGNIQKPRIGRSPNTPPTMNKMPSTERKPNGTLASPHLSVA